MRWTTFVSSPCDRLPHGEQHSGVAADATVRGCAAVFGFIVRLLPRMNAALGRHARRSSLLLLPRLLPSSSSPLLCSRALFAKASSPALLSPLATPHVPSVTTTAGRADGVLRGLPAHPPPFFSPAAAAQQLNGAAPQPKAAEAGEGEATASSQARLPPQPIPSSSAAVLPFAPFPPHFPSSPLPRPAVTGATEMGGPTPSASLSPSTAGAGSGSADEAIENMSVEQLLQQLYDGSWSGHDTILALSHFQAVSLRCVSELRTLSDGQWQQLRLSSALERSVRLYLLSTAQVESYATRMNLPSAREYSQDLLTQPLWRAEDLGKPLPHSPHACSVSLPLWRHVVGYEEGTQEVISAMACGYPRFFIHPYVSRLFEICERQFTSGPHETCFAFPSLDAAQRCATFLQAKIGFGVSAKIVPLGQSGVQAVVFRKNLRLPVRLYWQHFGDIISSRYAWDLLHGSPHSPHTPHSSCGRRRKQTLRLPPPSTRASPDSCRVLRFCAAQDGGQARPPREAGEREWTVAPSLRPLLFSSSQPSSARSASLCVASVAAQSHQR